MANVYRVNVGNFADLEAVSRAAQRLFDHIVEQGEIELPPKMPLKVHFGEVGNKTFIKPECYSGVRESLQKRCVETCYIETNVLYKGERRDSPSHINLAHRHGFIDLPVVIVDDVGYDDVPINGKHFKKCKIGLGFKSYDGFVVMSHFKGHLYSGFGGALKQLGMGFASRAGKLHQHTDSVPLIRSDRCNACGVCSGKCHYKAITVNRLATIDPKKCVGCAICVGDCSQNAIKNDWDASYFTEKLAEYAVAAAIGKKNVYINFLGQITEQCDCVGRDMKLITHDIGVFASTDPVAIDAVCLEALPIKIRMQFERGRAALVYAHKLGLGDINQMREIELE
jgi:uncharacterized Fe-S center protein